jgi:protein KRI1
LQDHQRAALLASSHSNFDPSGQPEVLPDTLIPLTHVQEERKLREEVTRAFHTAIPASGGGAAKSKGEGEDEDEDDDDFLVTKTSLQVDDAEAKKYRDFLLAQAGGEEGVREILGMGGFPERMQGQNQGKRDIKVVEGEEDAGDTIAAVDDAEGREGKAGDGKRVRTKDDDEEFLMK